MSELRELYQEIILEHNKTPRNFGKIETANRTQEGYNPLCGDHLHVHLHVNGDQIEDISFEGSGCAISKASASLMTEAVKGKPDLRIVHGLVGGPVLEVLEQVSAFLAANAHEIVILDFQHFYQVSQAQQAALLGQCLELFGVAGCIPPEKKHKLSFWFLLESTPLQ